MWLLWIALVFLFAFLVFSLTFWRRSSRFEKFFGFEPNFSNIDSCRRRKIKRIIERKRQKLITRSWEPDKENLTKTFEDFSETQAQFKEYCQMVAIAGFFGYRTEDD